MGLRRILGLREEMSFDPMELRRPLLPSTGDLFAEGVVSEGYVKYLNLPTNDLVPAIPQECRRWTRETEPKLTQPMPEARPRTESRGLSCPPIPPRDELDGKREQGRNVQVPCARERRYLNPIMLRNYWRTTPANHAGDPWVGRATCPSPGHREIAPSEAQHFKHEDVEKFAFQDEPGQDTGANSCWKAASWNWGPACPTTVSQSPPKPIGLILTGVSIAGAVLMTQWRLEYRSEWSDNPQSRFKQPELLSHPGVLVLGISLYSTALMLLYHLNGGDKRQDAFLIPITGATAVLASLLGLELSTILLRATPWATIIALCASTHGIWY